jgi:hypothetical protein
LGARHINTRMVERDIWDGGSGIERGVVEKVRSKL